MDSRANLAIRVNGWTGRRSRPAVGRQVRIHGDVGILIPLPVLWRLVAEGA